ncbi:MAG TPA: hypothetical protein VLF93_01905 [Candidatus Saccharimonadales bacterium]|nr:hypothetical protein [Candidatus Saccharimonadales bacterium]
MVSFIIIAKEKKKREEYINNFAKEKKVDRFDINIIEKDTNIKSTAQSIGIENVKLIQKKLFLKPIKSPSKIIVIEDAQLLTPEAQNALLKVIEEPPAHTYVFLGTETKEALLPTILSRCQLIELEEEKKKLSDKKIEELTLFLAELPTLSLAGRLRYAEQLAKDKDKALVWIENLIVIMREQLIQTYSQSSTSNTFSTNTIRSFQSLHTLLKTTNVNPRFAIENTLLFL